MMMIFRSLIFFLVAGWVPQDGHAFLFSGFPTGTKRVRRKYQYDACCWKRGRMGEGRGRPSYLASTPPTPPLSMEPLILELDPNQVLPKELVHSIQKLVDQRGEARWQGDYKQADQIKEQLFQIRLPQGIVLSLEDVPRSEGGGSVWSLQYQVNTNILNNNELQDKPPTVLQLAHAALGLAVHCSQTMTTYNEKQKQLKPLIEQAKTALAQWEYVHDQIVNATSLSQQQQSSLSPSQSDAPIVHPLFDNENDNDASNFIGWSIVETTLRGRKSADAAFWLALAGVADADLFELLACVCVKELKRFGTKSTCRAKDIYQMLDRFAAAGLTKDSVVAQELESVAQACLRTKVGPDNQTQIDAVSNHSLLDLHSDRCLLIQWKFSAGQKKQQSFLQSAQKHWELKQRTNGLTPVADISLKTTKGGTTLVSWEDRFMDPTLPLVIDVGCGMGLSLLGLASKGNLDTSSDDNIFPLERCNFLGVDLSGLAVGYAQGITERWGLDDKLQWEVDTAEALLASVHDSYPGVVSLCLIQFPTPYRLPSSSSGGNSQLPKSALEGFMVSPDLLQRIHKVLSKPFGDTDIPRQLILQSNCEDVAVWMKETAVTQCGFQALTMAEPVYKAADGPNLPLRTQNWIEMAGARAVGDCWSAVPLLPRSGSTETEVGCRLNGTPIHRCVLTPQPGQ